MKAMTSQEPLLAVCFIGPGLVFGRSGGINIARAMNSSKLSDDISNAIIGSAVKAAGRSEA